MTTVNKRYPHEMKDNEINDLIKEYTNAIVDARGSPNAVLQFAPLIQLGQNGLQGRHTKKAAYLSIGVSVLSLLIAGSALFVSWTSSVSNTKWEENQLSLISELKMEAQFISPGLEKVVSENTKNIQVSIKSSEKLLSLIEKLELKADNKPINPAK